jgi:beta-xylosidase
MINFRSVRVYILCIVSSFNLVVTQKSEAQKPLINHIYSADPSAHVWKNDTNTLWIYASHDVSGTNHHATMYDYHVFSTQNLVNWIDHGRVLSVADVPWAVSHAWAIDAAYWNKKYYLVYCMRATVDSKFKTGLAISDRPEGPFKDIGFIDGVENGQDPSLFIDDDNQPYLFWGSGGVCHAAKLTNNLLKVVPGSVVELTKQLKEVYEGPWVHKYDGLYYLSYPALPSGQWPEQMYYATAKNPLGPYTFKDNYIPWFEGGAGGNHGSITKFKDRWIAFYHSAHLSKGNGYNRNLMADFLTHREDGSIVPIVPSKENISKGNATCIIKLEAENGKPAGGMLKGVRIAMQKKGFSGRGYVDMFDKEEDYSEVLIQIAEEGEYQLEITYSATQATKIALMLNETMINGGYENWKDIDIPSSDDFKTMFIRKIKLKRGDNTLKLMVRGKDILLDYFTLKPVE